jgi:hypothetical protein
LAVPDLPGKALAAALIEESRGESRSSPIEAVIARQADGGLDQAAAHRLIGRLWTLERMLYYVYGGWGQGLEMNDFPPSIKYLFARQILDDSTHEMLYADALLKKGWARTQKEAFQHPSAQFKVDSALAYYVFSLRNMATYPHPIRIAGLNLGPKIVELAWMEGLAQATADPVLKGVFESQAVENRSHVNMGRRVVEEFIAKPIDRQLCRWACGVLKRDYTRFLHELSDYVLDRKTAPPPLPRVQVMD